MKERYLKAFNAIVEFVGDLCEVFENNKVTPLNLYRRLTQHIRFTDEKALLRAILPFEEFVKKYKKILMSGNLAELPRETRIYYQGSERAYIEIEKFIHQSDINGRSIIHQHLLTISTILNPSEEALKELEKKLQKLDLQDTPEGQMLNNIIDKIGTSMKGQDVSNPSAAIAHLMSSGVVGELFGGMQQGLGSGEMDLGRLVGSLQNTLSTLAQGATPQGTPPPSRPRLVDPPSCEEIKESPSKTPELD